MTSAEVIEKLREIHHVEPKMRCGARVTRKVTHFGGSETLRDLVCTEAPHESGNHKDAICCWEFHQFEFDSALPVIEDVWGGRACSCGRFDCETRAVLEL